MRKQSTQTIFRQYYYKKTRATPTMTRTKKKQNKSTSSLWKSYPSALPGSLLGNLPCQALPIHPARKPALPTHGLLWDPLDVPGSDMHSITKVCSGDITVIRKSVVWHLVQVQAHLTYCCGIAANQTVSLHTCHHMLLYQVKADCNVVQVM